MVDPVHIGDATLYCGDCLEILPTLGPVDAVVTDPPYGVTSLKWDRRVDGWVELLPSSILWCFGSLAFFLAFGFDGWKYSQEIIWEKSNGSVFHADRFRRVHELAVMFYKGLWRDLYHAKPVTLDATKRTTRRKTRPTQAGVIANRVYRSEDGGPRLARSVMRVSSCHGYAEHPTQKPIEIVRPLIEYSCPRDGSILDPFMGSGTTGVACARLGRRFIGIEIEPRYFDIACERIAREYAQLKLFPPNEPKGSPVQLELDGGPPF